MTVRLHEDAQLKNDSHWKMLHKITIDGKELPPYLAQHLLNTMYDDFHLARAKVLKKGRAAAGNEARLAYDFGSELGKFLQTLHFGLMV